MSQHTELIAKLRKFANTLTANIMTGHDHPNSQDELDRLNSARFLREAADALQALEPDDSGIVPDSDKVICPGCSHQFTAIPGNVQARLQALERVPMTEEVALKIAHRRATTYTHRSDPHYSGYAFVPYTLMDFVRDLEAHHNITPPESI